MTLKRVREPEKYLRMLKADSREVEQLYNDILISVTAFFREPEAFKALKSEIYPRFLKNRSSIAPIRIWVPGCSTGEEAYSHAINLAEFLGPRAVQVPFQIFATDVNPAVIEKARAGLYSKKIKGDISRERLHRFFEETKDGFRISQAIRERCVFTAKNLLKDPPFINLDLVSCRNLMIYLEPILQKRRSLPSILRSSRRDFYSWVRRSLSASSQIFLCQWTKNRRFFPRKPRQPWRFICR